MITLTLATVACFLEKKVVIIIISIQNFNFLAFKNDHFTLRVCEGVVCV